MAPEQQLLGVLDAISVGVEENKRAYLLALAAKANVTVVTALVGAIEGGLNEHGLAGVAERGVKTALTNAEPGIESALGADEVELIDALDAYLKAQAAANGAPTQ